MYSVTFVLGVVGNALILASVARHTHVKSSPVSVFLASLASADLMLILTCLPLKVGKRSRIQGDPTPRVQIDLVPPILTTCSA